jgi:D-alanyl-D-alanine carboxypeptidase
MRLRFLVLLLVIALTPAAAARRRASVAPSTFEIAAADGIAAAALRNGIPGITIAVQKGEAVFVNSWGVADIRTLHTVSNPAVYQIGSVTKQFTAAAIMRLAEEGKLTLDDRARAWIPELDARYDAVTIRQLLTHTSGVADYATRLPNAYEPRTQLQIVELINAGVPLFRPSALFSYSNSGYYLLGMIVERAALKPYAQVLRELFFDPLGLFSTSYCGARGPTPQGHRTGSLTPIAPADMSLVYAAGAVCSNAYDLLRWTSALESGLAVSPASYAQMTTSVDPDDMPPPGYGFALVVDTFEERRRIWHNGDILGFQTHVARFPDEQLTIVVLINSNGAIDRATPIAEEVARAVRP